MKIDFAKIPLNEEEILIQKDDVKFKVLISKINEKSAKCKGKIFGNILHYCDRCGDEFNLHLDENVEIIAYDGIAKVSKDELENIVEFFDSQVDFDEIFISELEAIKSGYFYCKKCKN